MDERKRRQPPSAQEAAEAVFRPQPANLPETRAPQAKGPASIPGAREAVSLRIDQDVLAVFQEQGPGWQDRINQALRKAAGLD